MCNIPYLGVIRLVCFHILCYIFFDAFDHPFLIYLQLGIFTLKFVHITYLLLPQSQNQAKTMSELFRSLIQNMHSQDGLYLLVDCDFTSCKLCPRAEHWTVDACNSQSPLRILQDKQQLSGCQTNKYFKIPECLKDLSNLEMLLRDYLRLFIVAASGCMLESLFTVAVT
jgi:hypothetical protein